ncbi:MULTISPECIES: hypothetical protein [Streptomyces]|uniref:hypothetical protein n=1 Tax=Streptomyces TaxID=1883 RepID=UPI0004CB3ECE|nr:hypothetical protein [Streptomyces sp. NRRL F-5650]
MRIRITLDIRTTPRASTTPPTVDTTPTPDTTPTTEATTPADTTPFGFTLDGTTLGSDTERAEPYDDNRGAEYEDDDARTGGQQ